LAEAIMMRTAEVGVVGAGPAGARAAELLSARGVEVVMFDPKAPWEKPCGGGLTPPAFGEMPELEELKPHARSVHQVRIEISPERGFTVPLDEPMWILSRLRLSQWQLDRALTAGAVHLREKVTSIQRTADSWLIETDQGPFRARFLVGADGAASLVRRVAAPGFRVELAPTRVAYPQDAGPTAQTVVLRFYSSISGYLWDFPRADHRSVGIGVPNGTWRRPILDGEIDAYRESSEPCSCPGLERAGAVIGTAQLGHGDFSRIAGERFALLGDAAGFADPLTGEGIQNSLRSAALFASAWDHGAVDRYPALARRAFRREFGISRYLRTRVFETDRALRLIGRSLESDAWYAVVVAIVNAVNEHDDRLWSVMNRWRKARRMTRTTPGVTTRGGREPVPCRCSLDEPSGAVPCGRRSTIA
jgi:flavin-dependent dehydrogenase